MSELLPSISPLLLAIAIGYLVGAVPIADQLGRRHGVDIFSEGTGLAGASNVRRYVGNWSALFVLLGDLSKGVLAVLAGRWLGVEGSWILLPAAAAIIGHWRSVFSGFRGGDGNATLGGVLIALFQLSGVAAVAAAILISLGGQRLPYSKSLYLQNYLIYCYYNG